MAHNSFIRATHHLTHLTPNHWPVPFTPHFSSRIASLSLSLSSLIHLFCVCAAMDRLAVRRSEDGSAQWRLEEAVEAKDWEGFMAAVADGGDASALMSRYNAGASVLQRAIAFGAPLEVLRRYAAAAGGTHAFTATNSFGFTAAHSACWSPRHGCDVSQAEAVLRYVVEECGVDPLKADRYGTAPIHYAAALNNLAAVRYLVEDRGADPGMLNTVNESPLMYATDPGYGDRGRKPGYDVVGYLAVTQGVDTTVRNTNVRGGVWCGRLCGRVEGSLMCMWRGGV